MADTHFSGVDAPTYKSNGVQVIGTQQAAEADLNQTIIGPSIAEVQAISDKVDALLAKLRAHGIIAT